MSFLAKVVEDKRTELEHQMAVVSIGALMNRAAHSRATRSLAEVLMQPGLSVIAEFKRRSPSAGWLAQGADAAQVARDYEAAGADAISVLTERNHFGGSPNDLARIRERTDLPLLRKDFILDEYQVYESRAIGADAVLLMASVLRGDGLRRMMTRVDATGLEALVEVHSEAELADALDAGATMVGINNRDLDTLAVDLSTVERLRPMVPDGVVVVSESGCRDEADVDRLVGIGVDAVLIGGALMTSDDIDAKMTQLFRKE